MQTYNGYEYFEMDYEPNDPLPRTYQIEIIQSGLGIYITFKDEMDIDLHLTGRVYRDPTQSSLRRFARVTYGLPVDLVVDGKSLIVNLLVGEGIEQ